MEKKVFSQVIVCVSTLRRPHNANTFYLHEVYCTHRHVCLKFLFLFRPICPTKVQKVAGVALLTTHQQKKKNHFPPNSFSTTEPCLSAPQMTIDFFLHVPNIRHMWLFQRRTTWCHLCAEAHLLTLTLVLVFFPLHIYMESVVCLCSVLWGVFVLLFERDIKQGQRGT